MLKSLPYIPLLLSSLSFSVMAADKENSVVIPAFNAQYTILRNNKAIGEATRKLSYLANGLAKYSYQTEIEWLIFSDSREETSVVKLEGYKVTPENYEYKRGGTGSDKHYKWRYDTANNSAIDEIKEQEKSIKFPENIQDSLSYHLQHRLNMITNPEQEHFVYPVIKTSGTIKNYVYQYDGKEELMLPYGLVKTIRLKREVVEKKRITYAWFAPELDYLLVKLYQIKADVEQFEVQLKSVTNTDATPASSK
ncbi:DUF3108 domain-containing protein [Colwellia sp. C1TZA3]|uniref:DUF3108 domain-containing protein n=1 Tax=Colwellia sp. C1TZA3 TaxID=2508879 RepID=UPI0011B95229|nr:DUF3108 domain-containing protein [Colwellia sp. C1TZA3]TWX65411.1 DUF3108 domain-containing protein [Colwellia sp. C1TZA3]